MADTFTWTIRFVHVLSGVMWIGGNFLWSMLIAPAILQRGPPMIRRPFLEATLSKLTRYLTISGSLTIISGFWVMGLLVGFANISDVYAGKGMPAAYGTALGIGTFAALALLTIGLAVIRPTAHKMLDLLQTMKPDAPPPAELPALGKRMAIASMTNILLGTIALGAMAWAVNTIR